MTATEPLPIYIYSLKFFIKSHFKVWAWELSDLP